MELEFWRWFFETMLWPIIILVVVAFGLAIIYKYMKPKTNNPAPPPKTELPEWDPYGFMTASQNRVEELPSRHNIPLEAREFAENFDEENVAKELLSKDDGEELTKKEQFLLHLIEKGKGKVSVKAVNKQIDAFGMKWKTDIELENQPEETFEPPKPEKPEDPDKIPEKEKEKEEEPDGT